MHFKPDDHDCLWLIHNEHCSKSRAAFDLAQAFAQRHALTLRVIDYLNSPLDLEQLRELVALTGLSAHALVREGEPQFQLLGPSDASEDSLLAAVVTHPVLLQRPIVIFRGRAVVARPPEILEAWLEV